MSTSDQICKAIVIKTKKQCSLKVSEKSVTNSYCHRHLSNETKSMIEQPKTEVKQKSEIETNKKKQKSEIKQTKNQLITELLINKETILKLIDDKIEQYNKTQLSLLLSKSQELIVLLNIPTKKKKVKITHVLKKQVWDTYIGITVGECKCPMCKVDIIKQMNFECGHLIPESKGGKTELPNLRPVCNKCNKSVGTNEMDPKHWEGLKQ
jgi:5-methylcytosine-specific restriction endonuclease McrA